WVVPYSILAIMRGAAGSALGSLRRSGTAGSGKGGMPSAEVCRCGFLRGGGPQVPSLRFVWARAAAGSSPASPAAVAAAALWRMKRLRSMRLMMVPPVGQAFQPDNSLCQDVLPDLLPQPDPHLAVGHCHLAQVFFPGRQL